MKRIVLAILTATHILQAAVAPAEPACQKPTFVMQLKNGEQVTGMLLGVEEGVSVVFKLPSGALKEYRWNEIVAETLTVSGDCASPTLSTGIAPPKPPPLAAMAPWNLIPPVSAQQAQAPDPDAIPFRITADRSGLVIERMTKSQLRPSYNASLGKMEVIRNDDWTALCEIPCRSQAPTAASLRVIGRGLKASDSFNLLSGASPIEISVVVTKSRMANVADWLMISGGTVTTVGLALVLAFGLKYDPPLETSSRTPGLASGGIILGVGAVALLVGVLRYQDSQPKIKQQPARRQVELAN